LYLGLQIIKKNISTYAILRNISLLFERNFNAFCIENPPSILIIIVCAETYIAIVTYAPEHLKGIMS
jgi:hypothetical protein